MVYRDLEKRRQAAKRRYWEARGISLHENNGNSKSEPSSLPQFVPEGQTIPDFQPEGRKRSLASAQNWFHDHSPTITGVIVPLAAGVAIGFVGTLFLNRYLGDLPEKAKSFISSYLPRQEPRPLSAMERSDMSLNNLLSRAQDYLDRTAGQ